jgi:hypothetical protein
MPMAPSRWFERIPDPITQAQAAVCGWDSPFTADSVVRYYQGRTLADWQRDTGDTADRVVISAGIGELVLDRDDTRFSPAARGMIALSAEPRPAPATLAVARLIICAICARLSDGRCSVAGCGCAGLGQAGRLLSRCPEGQW